MTQPDDAADETEATVDRLRPIIAWLVQTYEIRWPDCWGNHPGVVNDVEAMWRWWCWARSDTAPASELSHWHEGLSRFRERMSGVNSRCAGGCQKTR